MTSTKTFAVTRVRADVATLHALGATSPAQRLLRWCEPTDTALVIGRAQPDTDVVSECPIVRRRSGGGAVLVIPGDIVWFDVVVPAGDPLWETDVMRAFFWLGQAVTRALALVGEHGASMYMGALTSRDLPSSVCFAGVGPGEVVLQGRKALGISQRRTREATLFQCSLFRQHRTPEVASLLGLTTAEEAALDSAIATFPDLDVPAFEAALEESLPD